MNVLMFWIKNLGKTKTVDRTFLNRNQMYSI